MPHEALRLLRTADQATPTPTGRWLEAAALVLANRAGAPAARGAAGLVLQGRRHRAVAGRPACGRWADCRGRSWSTTRSRCAWSPILPDLRVELALRLAEAGIDAKAPEATARLLDLVEQAAPADDARARLLFLRGRLAAARGDFAGARASWREAVALPGEGGLRATLALLGSDLEARRAGRSLRPCRRWSGWPTTGAGIPPSSASPG